MGYLVRKISTTAWPDGLSTSFTTIDELCSDAIGDLKTQKNELSWWYIEQPSEIINVAASMITRFNNQQNNIRFVIIDIDDFLENEIDYENTPSNGDTAIIDMAKYHYDTTNMTYKTLGKISKLIANKTSSNDVVKVKWKDAMEIVRQKLNESMINVSKLTEEVKTQLHIL